MTWKSKVLAFKYLQGSSLEKQLDQGMLWGYKCIKGRGEFVSGNNKKQLKQVRYRLNAQEFTKDMC